MGARKRRRIAIGRLIGIGIALAVILVLAVGGSRAYHIYQTVSGAIPPDVPDETRYPVRGVDVAIHQGQVDWHMLSSQNISFAFIKATEGIDYVDPQFAQSWLDAAGAPVYVGAYHFWRFEDSGADQAQNFISHVPRTENTLPPVIDVEYYDDFELTADPAHIQEELRVMLDALENCYQVRPIIYAPPKLCRQLLGDIRREYPLWISNYYYKPFGSWAFWQYSAEGHYEGYDGEQQYIDLNVFNGTREEFLARFGLTEKG